jgi:hypothetical protein
VADDASVNPAFADVAFGGDMGQFLGSQPSVIYFAAVRVSIIFDG